MRKPDITAVQDQLTVRLEKLKAADKQTAEIKDHISEIRNRYGAKMNRGQTQATANARDFPIIRTQVNRKLLKDKELR